MMSSGGATVRDRAAHGFRLGLTRPPLAAELDRLVALYEQSRQRFQKDPMQAKQLATDPIGPVPKGMEVSELAAWTLVGNVLMNLDEFVARP
jgi:hypothetical protein